MQGRTIINLSAKDVENLAAIPKNTDWICIHDEHEPPHKLQAKPSLELRFADVRAITHHGGNIYHPATKKDVEAIVEFLKKSQADTILVNCNAGISRSGAIALFAHLHLGYSLKPNFWLLSQPNPFLLGALIISHLEE